MERNNFTKGSYKKINRPIIPNSFYYGEIISWKFRDSITPITRTHTYAYRFSLYFESENCCQKEIGGFTSIQEARKAREVTIFELQNRTYIPYKYTLQEFYDYYLYYYLPDERNVSYQTFCTYRNAIRHLFMKIDPNKKLIHLTAEDLLIAFNALSTENLKIQVGIVIRASLNVAKTKHLILYNPADYAVKKLKLIIKKNRQKKIAEGLNYYPQKYYPVLNIEEIGKLLLACKESDQNLYLPLLLAVSSGCRISELIAITYDDIDIWNQEIHITKQLGRNIYDTEEAHQKKRVTSTEVRTKSSAGTRKIPLSSLAYDEILLARKRYEELKRTVPDFHDNNYVCCQENGMPYHRGSFRKSFQKLLERCDFPPMRWHDLRHTFATILNDNEVNVKALAMIMGHKNYSITTDVYINPKIEVVDCSAQIDRFLKKIDFQFLQTCGTALEIPDYKNYLGGFLEE